MTVRAKETPVAYSLTAPNNALLGEIITVEWTMQVPADSKLNGLDVRLSFDSFLLQPLSQSVVPGSVLGGMNVSVESDGIHLWGEALVAASEGIYTLLTVSFMVMGTTGADTTIKTETTACYYVAVGADDPIQNLTVKEEEIPLILTETPLGPTTLTSDKYAIGNGVISKIPCKTAVSQFLSNLNERSFVSVYNGQGKELSSSDWIGTGSVVKLKVDGLTIGEWTAVVTGDVNGDGVVTAADYVNVKFHVLGKQKLSGKYAIAADVNGDGAITAADYVHIKFSVLGRIQISPR